MKNLKLFSYLIIASSLLFVHCTSDPVAGPAGPAGTDGTNGTDGVDGVSTGAGTSTTDLLAKKVFLGPVVDGVIDASWSLSQELVTTAEVPDPLGDDGTQVFQGYVGDQIESVIRAQYDDEYIYFLAEWKDSRYDQNRDTWYFDPADKLWKQESNKPVFDGAGVQTRQAFYEDKFAMLFNVNNSQADWDTNTCFATCHTGLTAAEGYSRHYTTSATATIDMWHWKNARTNFYGQFDDQRQDNAQPNGRHSDANDGQAPYTDNKQTLNNGTADVKVPLYFIPNREYYGWITIDEINSGTAKLITAVDGNGVLTYAGGTIDPNPVDSGYQRDGETSGKFGMPSIWVQPSNGSRGDITAIGIYTGSGWILEFKRKLNTGDTTGADVDFSSLGDFPFGYGIFDNAAIAHAIKPFLTLKFEQ